MDSTTPQESGAPHEYDATPPADPPSQGVRERGGHEMKRVIILALMLFAVLIPLTGIAQADLKSDEAIVQAP